MIENGKNIKSQHYKLKLERERKRVNQDIDAKKQFIK